jgi:hypothetical protein
MTHRHFCDHAGHYWECHGKALRPLAGDTEPSVCMCRTCGVPMEDGDHSRCRVELLACPEHVEGQRRQMNEAKQAFEQRKMEFGLDEKFAQMQAMPDSPDKDAAAQEIVDWLFRD